MATTATAYEVSPLDARIPFGAKVSGLRREQLEDPQVRQSLYDLWIDKGVILAGLGHVGLAVGVEKMHPLEGKLDSRAIGLALGTAAHRDDAVRLLEFLTSDEIQQWYADVNKEYPVRAGIPRNGTLARFGQFRADDVNLSRLGELNGRAVRLMDRAGWR